jgi:integrase
MARTARDSNIGTRTARWKLGAQREPYWRALAEGCAIGYRKGAKGGTWIARRYSAGTGREYCSLGTADDMLDADGAEVLSFDEAQEKARAWFADRAREAAGLEPVELAPYTVADAIKDYLAHYEARGGKDRDGTETVANARILPVLGKIDLATLTTKRIRDWHHDLAAAPARTRTGLGSKQRHRESEGDHDAKRRRQATANRVLTTLKAALNHAWHEGKIQTDAAWRVVKPFHDVDSPVIRYLTADECTRLVNATAAAFRPVVRAALLTGCRYGDLRALRASDFNPDSNTVVIRAGKRGKVRHVVLADEGRRFFEAAVAGKLADALIFARPDGEPWGKNHQQRPLTDACKAARISPAVSFHVLRHTHASLLAMKGVPMAVIGEQLGHAPGSRMTAKHYAHLAPSYVADTIRASFPDLGIVEKAKVATLRPKHARGTQ